MKKKTPKYNLNKIIFLFFLCLMLIVPIISDLCRGDENRLFFSRDIKTLTNWSEDVQLTNLSTIDHWVYDSTINLNNNFVHIIYVDMWQPGISVRSDLRYLQSKNGGFSWDDAINLTNTMCGANFPEIAVNNSNIYVVWQDWKDSPGHPEIYFKNSSDNGQIWQNDTALPTNIPNNDGIPSQKPHIEVWNNTLHVIWEDCRDDFYHAAGEIYYMRSLDGGITWDDGKGNVNQTQRLTFSGIETSSGCCEPTDIAVYENTVHVVGTQIRPTNERVVVYLNSLDNGQTWSNVTYLSPIDDGYNSACGSLAVKDNNTAHVAFSDDYYGVVYRNFTILNDTWSDIVPVHPSAMTDVQIAADCGAEKLFITFWSSWRSYYVISYDNGNFWYGTYNLSEEQAYSPRFAIGDGYVHAVFVSDRTGNSEIYYKRSPGFGTEPTNITITANPDVLTADGVSNSTLTIWVYNGTGSPVPNQSVSLSINGSGTVSNITDNGNGSYTANYTAGTDAGNVTITATVGFVSNYTTIILKSGASARIEIQPHGPVIYNKTESSQYTAIGYDIYQNINTTWQPIWKVDGDVGIINETGFFTATKEGLGTVNCSDAITGVYNISLVTVLNRKPIISSVSPLTNVTITEFQNQTFWVNASDDDGDNLTCRWYLNDNSLVNEQNLSYTFIPEENFSGNYFVKVSVCDGEDFANYTWIVTVINVKQLQETITNLQTQLEQLNESCTELLNTLTQLSEELMSIWSQLNNSELNNTELQTKIQRLNENISTLKNQLALSNQNTTLLQNLISNLNQILNLSNEQIAALWASLNQSMANESEFTNLITRLNQSINSLQEELNKLREENEQVVSERRVAEEKLMIAVVLLIGVVLVCVLIAVTKRKK